MIAFRFVVLAALVGVPGLPCSKKEEAPPVPSAPTPKVASPADVAKWTKVAGDYTTTTKAAKTRPDVVASMLALVELSKKTGDQVSYGMRTEVSPSLKSSAGSDLKPALDSSWDQAPRGLIKVCPPLDRRTNVEKLDFMYGFGTISPDPMVFVTSTISEAPQKLSLVDESGRTRQVRELEAKVVVRIQAPGKPDVVVERKVDVRGFSLEGMVHVGKTFADSALYAKEVDLLQERTCAAARDILGLQDVSAAPKN